MKETICSGTAKHLEELKEKIDRMLPCGSFPIISYMVEKDTDNENECEIAMKIELAHGRRIDPHSPRKDLIYALILKSIYVDDAKARVPIVKYLISYIHSRMKQPMLFIEPFPSVRYAENRIECFSEEEIETLQEYLESRVWVHPLYPSHTLPAKTGTFYFLRRDYIPYFELVVKDQKKEEKPEQEIMVIAPEIAEAMDKAVGAIFPGHKKEENVPIGPYPMYLPIKSVDWAEDKQPKKVIPFSKEDDNPHAPSTLSASELRQWHERIFLWEKGVTLVDVCFLVRKHIEKKQPADFLNFNEVCNYLKARFDAWEDRELSEYKCLASYSMDMAVYQLLEATLVLIADHKRRGKAE